MSAAATGRSSVRSLDDSPARNPRQSIRPSVFRKFELALLTDSVKIPVRSYLRHLREKSTAQNRLHSTIINQLMV